MAAKVDLGTILDLVTLALVAVGLLLWRVFGSAAEHGAKAQVDELITELNRASALARDLEKTRGTERQELRFTSYGKLWAAMRPLAIYDRSPIDPTTMGEMSKNLSDWYFSEAGGLMLTTHNRDPYFALQDLVSAVADQQGWEAERTREPKTLFLAMLNDRPELTAARALVQHLDEVDVSGWPSTQIGTLARAWRDDVAKLAEGWPELDGKERFAVLQQVASVLRTGLTNDVESRLR
jgi:hypothetical protein